MKLSYELVIDDLIELSQFHNTQSPAVRRNFFGCLALAFIGLLPLPALVFMTNDQPFLKTAQDIMPLLWPILLFPIFATFLTLFVRWRTRRLVKHMLNEGDNSGNYGPCTMTLNADGIVESKESGDTQRKWPAVKRIVVSATHIFVYTAVVEAFVIPRHAFDREADFDSFLKYLCDHSIAELQHA